MLENFPQQKQSIPNQPETVPQWKRPAVVPQPLTKSGGPRKPILKRPVPWQMTVGAILLALVFTVHFSKDRDEVSEPVSSNTENNSTVSDNSMEDWQTYQNDEYGFEFKYPKNLFIHLGPTDTNDWLIISQKPDEPLFAFEDACNGSLDYVNVQFGTFTPGYGYNTIDEFIDIVESNYKTHGGGIVSDTVGSGFRRVVYEAPQVYGKKIQLYTGVISFDFSYQSCAGGDIPFDEIVDSLGMLFSYQY